MYVFFSCYGDHRDLHVLTHSFPTRRSSDLNVNPIGPRGVYDEAKRYAEAMTMAYHRHHDVDVRIVRIFNTFGTYMRPDDGRAVSNFLTQALEHKPITAIGDGSQSRSFTSTSGEHTSALQSLMRTSDAVFCLTTKKVISHPDRTLTSTISHR